MCFRARRRLAASKLGKYGIALNTRQGVERWEAGLLSGYRYSRPVLLEMAIAAEESAKTFYSALSRRFPEHSSFFNQLAGDEEQHAETYRRLLSGGETYASGDERTLADRYIQALETSGLVSSLRRGGERAVEAADLKTAMQAAVQMEKDTVLLYHSIAMAAGKEDRLEIYRIIDVELGHLAKIESLLKTV
ncbi:MAG: ferritin family protein [Candidatus Brockarchaeota archaeon]|nr:ferritin family protein [Candidatus Brockarchaeota archaeon]